MRLVPAHGAAGAMTGGAERQRFVFRGADKNVGAGAHRTADQHRLAHGTKLSGNVGMTGTEGARGALAVHVELAPPAVHDMFLYLAGVVRHVVKQGQT